MKHGNENIMTTLQKNKTWISHNKFFTHREASNGFIKYTSTAFTIQQVTKEQIVNFLMNLELNIEKITTLSTIPKDDMITTHASSKKRSTDDQPKVPEEDINKHVTFPAFDLSTKKLYSTIHLITLPQLHMRSNSILIRVVYSKSF